MLDSLSLFNDKVSALDAYQSKLPEADQSAYASILQEIHSIYSQSKNNQLSLLRKIGRIQKFIEVTALRRPETAPQPEAESSNKTNLVSEENSKVEMSMNSAAMKMMPDASGMQSLRSSTSRYYQCG